LATVLTDAVVFFYSGNKLAAFKGVVRTGFLDVNVFAGLDRPDGLERVPMIGRGDGDGIDVFVFEELAKSTKDFGLGMPSFSTSARR